MKAIFERADDEPGQVAVPGEVDVQELTGFGDGFEPPRGALRARLHAQRKPAAVLVIVAVLTAAATALATWFMRPVPTELPATQATGAATFDEHHEPAAPTSAAAPEASSAAPEQIVVAVVGQVAAPGLVTLAEGARVSDAIAAAGGPLPGTDLSAINIARKVSDGEQISVGIPPAADAASPNQPGAAGAPAAPPGNGKVNVNSATAADLDALPGIGPVIAQRIVDHRTDNGPFKSIDDLQQVSGIGPAVFGKIKDLVTV